MKAKESQGIEQLQPVVYPRHEHPISRENIDEDALKIMYRLIRHGYKAFLVGGGVRDLLLRKKPKDYDIATDATPRRVKEIFRNSRVIGRRFKLVHVFFRGGKIIEVSTFRDFSDPIEIEENADNEAAPVAHDNKYGTEVTDALRRDLTINGLFYDLSSFSIIDYVGGVKDLSAGIIRIIGDPDTRFAEDPVRMLRAVRHAARSGFTLETSCRESIAKNKALLLQCSSMRVYEEIKKDLRSGHALDIIRLLNDTQLLEYLMPELSVNRGELLTPSSRLAMALQRLDAFARNGREVSATAVLALVALFTGTNGELVPSAERFEDREVFLKHLRACFSKIAVPRKERERVEDVLAAWQLCIETVPEQLKLSSITRRDGVDDLLLLIEALNEEGEYDHLLQRLRETGHSHHHDDDERRDRRGRSRRRGPRGYRNRSHHRARATPQ